jgi:protein SCO1/2
LSAGIAMNAPHTGSKMHAGRGTMRALCCASALVMLCVATNTAVSVDEGSKGSASAGPRLTSFVFHDQLGQAVTRRGLQGHVWIADFMYTACRSACPLLTSRLLTLQHRLPDPTLRFVSFSVDPETDNPETLHQYAQRWNERENRWRLLSTDPSSLADLTSSMKLELSLDREEIVHTNRFFLIDAEGKVVSDYDSSDDVALEPLLADTARLLGSTPANAVNGAGRELFSSLGCAGCHSDSQLAPPLAGLLGTRVMFERGDAIVVDDAYLHESIATPGTRIVAGYPNSMPTYGSVLTRAQLSSLVSYVHSLPGEPLAGRTESTKTASPETDPVCGMPTRVTEQTPSLAYQGHAYHFCSLGCAKRFQSNPAKYVADPGARPHQ